MAYQITKIIDDCYEDKEFEGFIALTKDEPKDIANAIESSLVADMKQDTNNRKFNKIVRIIILKIAESKEWEEWFGRINDKKAAYTFSMKSGDAQKSLFSLMDINDENLDRLAKLSQIGNIQNMLDKMERQQELERENEARKELDYISAQGLCRGRFEGKLPRGVL